MKVVYVDLQSRIIKNEYIDNDKELIVNENDLVFKAPRAVGYKMIGANRIQVYSNGKKSSSGGYFATALKNNGHDYLVIKNKSQIPVYLYIDKYSVLIRDARDIWDKNFDLVENVEIAQIGLAGANKLDFAKIMFRNDKSLGKNGLGKLMGEKNLKAIALNNIDNSKDKKENRSEILEKINFKIANKISNNYNIEEYFKEDNNCYGCCLNCESTVLNKILKYNFKEEEANLINNLSNKYGMDSIATSEVVSILGENEEFKNKSIEEIVEFVIYNEEYKINDKDINKNIKNNKKEKNELENTLEDLGFCKFL
ncbi:MAG: aldehyde ferredoxin oxidoreductase N-terminal domain-containing protein, partial [Peptostreptococcaceae bacterium]